MGAAGYSIIASPACQDGPQPSAGVGIASKRPLPIHPVKPRPPRFLEFQQIGRACIAILGVGQRTHCIVVSAYGWVKDGFYKKQVATGHIIDAIREELSCWPKLPVVAGCDLNAQATSIAPCNPCCNRVSGLTSVPRPVLGGSGLPAHQHCPWGQEGYTHRSFVLQH